ncbi:MAG: cobalamin-binding protein [Thermoanaerobacteraceae bacterium]|mgnify:FL=1|nr:cobalamin-binding protein [Thermoanaerobacteraceae bacterium]
MEILKQISENLQSGNAAKVGELVKAALEQGISPKDILEGGLINGMDIIGVKFKNNEVYVPEVLIAARAMHAGMDILKPVLSDSGVEPLGKVVLGTVKGDLHDIGKNLVKMMMEGAGFEVIDLGVDVTADKFVDAVKESHSDVLAMSALLTTTMPYMKTVIETLEKAGLREQVKIMVGGAPITDNFAKEIDADGYAADAASAADKCKELLKVS